VAGLVAVALAVAASVADVDEVLIEKVHEVIVGGNPMRQLIGWYKNPMARLSMFVVLVGLIISMESCNQSEKATAAKPAQETFASPPEAGAALLAAAKSGDQNTLLTIFGPESKDVLFTGDAVKDKDGLEDFVAAYDQMNRWVKIKAGAEMLYVGADNYPFPVPLGQNSDGRWYFDTPAGKDEILARRIGKDELTAIAALAALVDAQEQYFSQTHDGAKVKQYAQKFVSDAGKQNGLYWPTVQGQTPSPLGQFVDFAKSLGYTNSGDKPQPFNGYYFQILTKQGDQAAGGAKSYIVDGNMTGGFAILAYPADYRNSGIMTFIVDKDGVVFQKDLGDKTQEVATAMAEYNPGDGWVGVVGAGTQYVARNQ